MKYSTHKFLILKVFKILNKWLIVMDWKREQEANLPNHLEVMGILVLAKHSKHSEEVN